MQKKFLLMPLLLITSLLISGCIFDKDNGTAPPVKSDVIPTTNLPTGFTYMGTHETPVNIGGSSINATEGVYRNNGEDVYIQVIENGNPGALVAQYKQQVKKEYKGGYDPFREIYLNGHNATQVTDYTTINAQQKPNYAIIWATGKAMILVSSPTADIQTVLALASATGV